MTNAPYSTSLPARAAIQTLLNGDTPNFPDATTFGDWALVIADLSTAHTEGGTAAVRRVFTVLCRAHPQLASLIAGDAPPLQRWRRATAPCRFPRLPLRSGSIKSRAGAGSTTTSPLPKMPRQ